MSTPFLGEIRMFGGNFAPRYWAFCNGQLLSIAQNTALFSLLGTTYGGNGTTTFGLPDLRSRTPIGSGQGPGLPQFVNGQLSGQETVTLTLAQIPAHTHTTVASDVASAPNAAGLTADGTKQAARAQVVSSRGNFPVAMYGTGPANQTMGAQAIAAAGGNTPHENRQPYLAINFIIATQGIFPSRN